MTSHKLLQIQMITMRINKEFKISFLIFIPLGALNS